MKTLADVFFKLESDGRADLLLARRRAGFETISATAFAERVRRAAGGLRELGVRPGDRVGLICSNRPDWHVVDFACHLNGAILVPIFATLTPGQVGFIFANAGCKVVVVEGGEQVDKVVSVRDRLPELEQLVFIRSLPTEEVTTPPSDPGDDVDALLEEMIQASPPLVDAPGPDGEEAVATIIYTSGTTGEPKGVMLTHANLLSNIRGALQVLDCRPVDRALSVLPLCHSFQRIVDYTFFYVGGQIAYGSPLRLAEEYLLVKPTVVAGVPRLFERFRAAVLEQVATGGAMTRRIFRWAEGVGQRRAEHELLGRPFGMVDRLQFAIADRLVMKKVRESTGGKIFHFVSGGAALDPSLNWWFEAMGLRLLQGYGLTETSPVISANPHEACRIGTVGVPLPGIEVKIAEDGEILTRGPHIMKGYWNNPEATAEMIVDGWLRTGDVGTFEDGYLSVTDRKKHLLVMSTGKNVAPQPLENALSMSAYIEQVAVVGDGQRFIGALVVPDFAILGAWARRLGKDDSPDALCADADVFELLEGEIEAEQREFARFECVRSFRLLSQPFSIEDGTLTPTLKAVRRVVEAKHADLIADIYRENGD